MKQNIETVYKNLMGSLPKVIRDDAYFSWHVDSDAKQNDQSCLALAYKKLMWLQILHTNRLITITGVQGAGKSTLLKTLLDLPDDIVLINEGRGEVHPFIIRENSTIKSIRAIREEYGFTDESVTSHKAISVHDWDVKSLIEYIQSPGENEHSLSMPILEIPSRTPFGLQFLMMPGIEMEKVSENWQELLKFILENSKQWLLVTDQTRLVHEENRLMFNWASENEVKNPIVIVSKSESLAEDTLNDLRNKIISLLPCMAKENAPLFFSRLDVQDWKEPLTKTIAELVPSSLMPVNGKAVKRLIRHSIKPVILNIQSSLQTTAQLEGLHTSGEIQKCLEHYEKRVDELRDLYLGAVSSVIRYHGEDFDKKMHELRPNMFGRAFDWATKGVYEKRHEFRTHIYQAWDPDSLKTNIAHRLQTIAEKDIKHHFENKSDLEAHIRWFLNDGEKPKNLNPQAFLEVCADLCLMGITSAASEGTEHSEYFSKSASNTSADEFNAQSILATMAMFVDASDGKVDSIPAVLTTLGIPATALTYVTGALAVGAILKLAIDTADKYVEAEYDVAVRWRESIRASTLKSYVEAFDVLMKNQRRFIERKLEQKYGVQDIQNRQLKYGHNIGKLMNACSEMISETEMSSLYAFS